MNGGFLDDCYLGFQNDCNKNLSSTEINAWEYKKRV